MSGSSQAKHGGENPLTEAKDDFLPNIPIAGAGAGTGAGIVSGVGLGPKEFEKPALRGGSVRFTGNKRGCPNFGESVVIEDSCEGSHKLSMVKYVVGGSSDLGLGCESGNASTNLGQQRGCLSEKSSDSGVSSSSLSSAPPPRDKVLAAAAATESPTKSFPNFVHRGSPNSSQSSTTGLKTLPPDTTTGYQ